MWREHFLRIKYLCAFGGSFGNFRILFDGFIDHWVEYNKSSSTNF